MAEMCDYEGLTVSETLEAEQYDFLRFTFGDMHGISRSRVVAQSSIRRLFESGIQLPLTITGLGLGEGSLDPIRAVYGHNKGTLGQIYGNVLLRPVSGTLHSLPYAGQNKFKVGQVLCETFLARTGDRHLENPRYVARHQLKRLEALGYYIYSTFEIEFLLVDPQTLKPVTDQVVEAISGRLLNQFEPVLLDISDKLLAMGVEVEMLQIEYSQGQFELTLKPQYGIKIADNAFLVKDCVKQVTVSHGYKAVFMTKKGSEMNCNGWHQNHSLVSVNGDIPAEPDSAFYDADTPDKLSEVFTHWMGGLVHHYEPLITFCGPTVNCFRRLKNMWAPTKSDWGIEDRMATFRVKNEGLKLTYIENRMPSGSCNPYIVLATVVAAGVDGLNRKLPCPHPTMTDLEKQIYDTHSGPRNAYTDMEVTTVPHSLREGLDAVQAHQQLIKLLGEDFVKFFVVLKEEELEILKDSDMEKDDSEMLRKECEMYLNVL